MHPQFFLFMPELPEVEMLVRHLSPRLKGRIIREVEVFALKKRVLRPFTSIPIDEAICGAEIMGLQRRGKFILFHLQAAASRKAIQITSHLGMTGRMYLAPQDSPNPKHAVIRLGLDEGAFIFEDARGFGRFSLDDSSLGTLGPEPLGEEFTIDTIFAALSRSSQPIKTKLLDQSLVAGIGNIYASESLYHARIWPLTPCNKLTRYEVTQLMKAIRFVLEKAIRIGENLNLQFEAGQGNGIFYYGSSEEGDAKKDVDRFEVYDREGQVCRRCAVKIVRTMQANRSTFHCPGCQNKRIDLKIS